MTSLSPSGSLSDASGGVVVAVAGGASVAGVALGSGPPAGEALRSAAACATSPAEILPGTSVGAVGEIAGTSGFALRAAAAVGIGGGVDFAGSGRVGAGAGTGAAAGAGRVGAAARAASVAGAPGVA